MEDKERESILKLMELLELEKREDLKQYQEKFLNHSIIEREKNGLTWGSVLIQNQDFGYGGNLVLEIERTKNLGHPHLFQQGKNTELFTSQHENVKPIHGTIKASDSNKLTIVFNCEELPDWCYDGKLGLNVLFDEFSYREMDLALSKMLHTEDKRILRLINVLMGEKEPQFEYTTPFVSSEDLNSSQNEALKKALSVKDFGVIHGPPGTGKTTTLATVIKSVLESEKQVMVSSPSNTGIDVICEKLTEKGIKVLRLGNPVRVSESLIQNTLEAQIQSHSHYKELMSFKKRAEEFKEMAKKYKRNFGPSERAQKNALYAEARALSRESASLEDYIVSDLIEKAQVIACTLVGASNKLVRNRIFSSLFIDEAAQALEPATWIPILKCERVIFAGDHFQLPPTVKSAKAAKGGLEKSLLEKVIHKEGVSAMLKTQYRMNQQIMNFSNNKFYNTELLADKNVATWSLGLSDETYFNHAVEFIDTSGCGFEEESKESSTSINNPGEASILIRHLNDLCQQFLLEKEDKLTVGIISPYKAQVNHLVETVDDHFVHKCQQIFIKVKSVDGFQGQEMDVIYISLVRSNDRGEIGFLSDVRRMNVALTRARKKLVVIGDAGTLASHPFYKDFFDYIDSIHAYRSAWEYLD